MPILVCGVERACARSTSDVYDEVMATVDKQLIVRALETSGGRIREAARRLGLARNTVYRYMRIRTSH